MKRVLLAFESFLTAVPFIASWLICAIILSVKAGYLMAMADAAKKMQTLDALWPTPKFMLRWHEHLRERWAQFTIAPPPRRDE